MTKQFNTFPDIYIFSVDVKPGMSALGQSFDKQRKSPFKELQNQIQCDCFYT